MLPPALARAESIYPLGGADVTAARRWLAKARLKPSKLVLYTWNDPPQVAMAEVLAFNLKQIGIDLEVKYFDLDAVFERTSTRGEPFDIVLGGWVADYPDPCGLLRLAARPDRSARCASLVDPRVLRRMERRTVYRRGAAPCLGGRSTST